MLKSLDILLSLISAMLAASLGVTVLTQIYLGLRNTRGSHLRDGLMDLLKQIDPAFTKTSLRAIAESILSHPLIRDAGSRLGSLVHRDEFTHLLMELAAGTGPQVLETEAKAALLRALQANGIPDPAASLEAVQDLSLEFESSHPFVASHIRRDMAILHAAKSDLVATVNHWFDQTIDRISARFTFTARQVALVAAAIVAITLQLDSVELIRRLINGGQKPTLPAAASWAGIALSTLLLSLGAPFWFEALKNMLRLRSVIAGKDDAQRSGRTTAGTPSEH